MAMTMGMGEEWWWWGAASSVQLAAGIRSVRRGLNGGSAAMPLKAFLVATLFVSGGATAVVTVIHANGIRELEDWKQIGAGIRRRLGAPPRRNVTTTTEDLRREKATATSMDDQT